MSRSAHKVVGGLATLPRPRGEDLPIKDTKENMLKTTTARFILIGLSAAAASSVHHQLVEEGFFPEIGTGNGDDGDDVPSLWESDDCGCVRGEGKFCGTDGQCHFYNCEEYYKYGPVEFTGYGPDAPGLECSDTAETEPNPQHSPSWRCGVFLFPPDIVCC